MGSFVSCGLIACLGLSAQSTKPPAAPKPHIDSVIATGCVAKVADPPCLLLKTLDGKNVYVIASADTVPQAGSVITLEGKPHHGRSTCKQGLALDVSKWESTGEECVR